MGRKLINSQGSHSGSIRLQKFLAECGAASRRRAEELILAKKVSVNGKVVSELGFKVDPRRDLIRLRGKIIKRPAKGVLLLHKPRGVVSTLSDPQGRPTVADFLTKHYRSYFPVGRLDWETTGLLVLTNDGELAETLSHPKHSFARVYEAKVEGLVTEFQLEKLRRGVFLVDGQAQAESEILESRDNYSWLRIVVREGRNRLVRRLMEKIRHPIVKLRRVEFGPFKLGKLRAGELRKLTEKEYLTFKSKIFKQIEHAPQSRRDFLSPRRLKF